MSRVCGTCTLCCRLFAVSEILKPRDHWCRHCLIGKGCGIYPKWPGSCRDFFCLYREERPALLGGKVFSLSNLLTDDMRPDRCGTVMVAAGNGTAICAVCKPDAPFAWRDNAKVFAFLTGAAAFGLSISVRSGSVYFVVGSRGYLEVPKAWVKGSMNVDGQFTVDIPEALRMQLGIGPDCQERLKKPIMATASIVH